MSATRRNGNRARCQHEGCEKFAQTRGLCKAHGGGSRCRDPSCNKLAQSRGLCIAHGGGRRCQHQGCSKLAQSKGFCISHGGGRRCTVPNCEKFSQVKGRCKSHSKLADNSDQEVDDGEETETEQLSDRAMASPPSMDQARGHFRMRSPPSPMHSADAAPRQRVDYLANPLPRLRSHEALPLPPASSFGLSSGMPLRQSLPLPRPVLYGISNRENMQTQQHDGYDHDMEADASHRGHPRGSIDAFKHVPRFQEEEELRPLPYSYPLPSSRTMFDRIEEKRESEAQQQSYLLLPPRFLQSATTAMPSISHMATSSASAYPSDHFASHGHHHAPAVEPTSIPLLSFLDRNKDSAPSQPMRAPSWTSSSAAAPTERSASTSPPLPSIVLPSLTRHNQNPNLR